MEVKGTKTHTVSEYHTQLEKVAELGDFLTRNYRFFSISNQEKKDLVEKWGISEKTFNKVFLDYLKENPFIAKTSHTNYHIKPNGRARAVVHTKSEKVFNTIKEAAENLGVNFKTLERHLRTGTGRFPLTYVK